MGKRQQGAQANRTGKVLENIVISTLSSHGFEVVDYPVYIKREGEPTIENGNWLVRRVPYKTIYGHEGKTEFLIVSRGRETVCRVECKWQQVAGSVDEKFPYLIENCKTMPEPMIIILIDGGGYKEGALAWLKNAAEKCRKEGLKDIRIFGAAEFMGWANSTF